MARVAVVGIDVDHAVGNRRRRRVVTAGMPVEILCALPERRAGLRATAAAGDPSSVVGVQLAVAGPYVNDAVGDRGRGDVGAAGGCRPERRAGLGAAAAAGDPSSVVGVQLAVGGSYVDDAIGHGGGVDGAADDPGPERRTGPAAAGAVDRESIQVAITTRPDECHAVGNHWRPGVATSGAGPGHAEVDQIQGRQGVLLCVVSVVGRAALELRPVAAGRDRNTRDRDQQKTGQEERG